MSKCNRKGVLNITDKRYLTGIYDYKVNMKARIADGNDFGKNNKFGMSNYQDEIKCSD